MKVLRRELNSGTFKGMLLLGALVSIMLASTAMAASVTLSGAASGTYTLDNMTINSNGDIILSVSGGSTPPPPGALNMSLSPATLPSGTAGSAYSNTVTMTASGGTSPYTYSCSGSGVAGIAASNNGSICTISGTPSASGVYSVNFSVNDAANPSAVFSTSISFSVSAPSDPSKCIDIGPRYPAYLDNQSIPAKGIVNYCFTIDRTVSAVVPYIRSRDWKTNSHMFVSNVSNPTMDEINRVLATNSTINRVGSPPWYSFGSYSNERLVLSKSAKAGDKFYVTVYNSDSVSSLVQLYWEAF